ncbi:MAG: MOSC domain-containing protein [Alphaproteobacteria bacterium]|nr:MOSC domain-containing protein [Alphaproteobacteria bacterium]
MSGTLAHIWRHPIKSHGREELAEITLTEGKCLPMDRRWAVAHEQSCFDDASPRWQPCREFSTGAKSPRLQAITIYVDQRLGRYTVSHPDRVDLTFDPETEGSLFVQWVMPISNGARTLPARFVRAAQAMTDTDYASISMINMASHRALEATLGHAISPNRWRSNLLVEGLGAWAENDMIDRRIRIGEVVFEVIERIRRCMATAANPETGERDVDTLGTLKQGFGHQDMGVYLLATKSGHIRQDDKVELI